jgi:dihydropyrimidine dehydrogenase (NAD+) subunit PreT
MVQVPDSQSTISCNFVVPAIGQSPLSTLMQQFRQIEIRDGRILVDPASGRTGNARYYAGGDCVNGGREVVDAVADGKRAALAMLQQAEAAHA